MNIWFHEIFLQQRELFCSHLIVLHHTIQINVTCYHLQAFHPKNFKLHLLFVPSLKEEPLNQSLINKGPLTWIFHYLINCLINLMAFVHSFQTNKGHAKRRLVKRPFPVKYDFCAEKEIGLRLTSFNGRLIESQ